MEKFQSLENCFQFYFIIIIIGNSVIDSDEEHNLKKSVDFPENESYHLSYNLVIPNIKKKKKKNGDEYSLRELKIHPR